MKKGKNIFKKFISNLCCYHISVGLEKYINIMYIK